MRSKVIIRSKMKDDKREGGGCYLLGVAAMVDERESEKKEGEGRRSEGGGSVEEGVDKEEGEEKRKRTQEKRIGR